MNTCKDCEWCRCDGSLVVSDRLVVTCTSNRAFPYGDVYVWADFGCPQFKAKQDWAEKAAVRADAEINKYMRDEGIAVTWIPVELHSKIINIFREEATKAGVK